MASNIFYVLASNNIGRIQQLLRNGVDPNIKNMFNDIPLHLASEYGFLETIELLLKAGANPNVQNKDGNTPLHNATKAGKSKSVKLLLTVDDIDVNIKNIYGQTALHEAVYQNNIEIVSILLEAGAYVDIVDNFKITPLDMAINKNYNDIIDLLQSYMLDIKEPDSDY